MHQNYSPVPHSVPPPVVVCSNPSPAPPPQLVLWAPFGSAVAVGLVSAFAAAIAYRQWRTAQTKVQLDLYDKRIPIYRACVKLAAEAIHGDELDPQKLEAFRAATANAEFIFDGFISSLVSDFWIAGFQLVYARRFVGPRTWEAIQEEMRTTNALRAWFEEQGKGLAAAFEPYLQLEARKTKRWQRTPVPRYNRPPGTP